MKLPNGEHAIVDISKLTDYCLNPHHLRGRHKARVFAAVNITLNDAEQLHSALVVAAKEGEAELGPASPYGQRYLVDVRFHPSGPEHTNPECLDREDWRGAAVFDNLFCTIGRECFVPDIEMHAVVALLENIPEQGLIRGQVGTIVADWAPGVYEVEFSDGNGVPYAMIALKAEQLMVLHHEPVHEAA